MAKNLIGYSLILILFISCGYGLYLNLKMVHRTLYYVDHHGGLSSVAHRVWYGKQ